MTYHYIKKDIRLALASLLGDARLLDISSQHRNDANVVIDRKRSTSRVHIIGCPDYGNLGDHAIALAERRFIESRIGLEPNMFYGPISLYWDILNHEIQEGDVICLQGGGNMGTLYESYENERLSIIDRFNRNRIVLFPQTISYGYSAHERRYIKHVSKVYERHPDLHLVARERMSLERMRALFPSADITLTPDIVLSLLSFDGMDGVEREGLCLCLRTDKERKLHEGVAEAFTDAAHGRFGAPFRTDTMHSSDMLSPGEGETAVVEKIIELSKAKLVVTDRIHGMIFCALSGTPCISLDNSNGKVGQEYEWLKHLPYMRFARSVDEAINMLKVDAPEPGRFPSEDFSPLFDPLTEALSFALS